MQNFKVNARTHSIISAISQKTGLVFDYDATLPANVAGFYDAKNKKIVLNPGHEKALDYAVVHELTHFVENKKGYGAYVKNIMGSVIYKDWIATNYKGDETLYYKEIYDTYYENYKQYDDKTLNSLLEREMVAKFNEYLINEKPEALARLSKNDTGIKAVYNSICEFFEEIKTFLKGDSEKAYALRMARKFRELTQGKEVAKSNDVIKYGVVNNVSGIDDAESIGSKAIAVNMNENDRYVILKDKKITPVQVQIDETIDIDFEFLANNIKSVIEKSLISKLRKLGYLKKYTTNSLEIDFEFTGKGASKSLHSQVSDYGGNFADFTKVMLNLQDILDNSILIETHTDKGIGTSRENIQLKQTFVLFGAFQDGSYIKPVQFEVKEYVDNNNRLYLAVALTKIETSVMGNTMLDKNQTSTYLLPVSTISIADIFSKINPVDKNFLKYVPNQFLNEKQIKAKNIAIGIVPEEGNKAYNIGYIKNRTNKVIGSSVHSPDGAQNVSSANNKITHPESIVNTNSMQNSEKNSEIRQLSVSGTAEKNGTTTENKSKDVENKNTFDSERVYKIEKTSYNEYTKEEYENYGWARANNILYAGQNSDYRSKFAMAKSGQAKFSKSKSGEFIIPVSDINDSTFRGINNVLVFASGEIDKPIITKVIEIFEYDETELDKVRRNVYELERRGIQQKTGNIIRQYNANDSGIQHYGEYIKSRRHNNDNGNGRGNSEQTSSTEEPKKYSIIPTAEKNGTDIENKSKEERYQELIKKYRTIPQGENPYREVEVPKRSSDKKYVSRHARVDETNPTNIYDAQNLIDNNRIMYINPNKKELNPSRPSPSFQKLHSEVQLLLITMYHNLITLSIIILCKTLKLMHELILLFLLFHKKHVLPLIMM